MEKHRLGYINYPRDVSRASLENAISIFNRRPGFHRYGVDLSTDIDRSRAPVKMEDVVVYDVELSMEDGNIVAHAKYAVNSIQLMFNAPYMWEMQARISGVRGDGLMELDEILAINLVPASADTLSRCTPAIQPLRD